MAVAKLVVLRAESGLTNAFLLKVVKRRRKGIKISLYPPLGGIFNCSIDNERDNEREHRFLFDRSCKLFLDLNRFSLTVRLMEGQDINKIGSMLNSMVDDVYYFDAGSGWVDYYGTSLDFYIKSSERLYLTHYLVSLPVEIYNLNTNTLSSLSFRSLLHVKSLLSISNIVAVNWEDGFSPILRGNGAKF